MDGDRNGYASYKVADDVTDGNVEQIRSYAHRSAPAPARRARRSSGSALPVAGRACAAPAGTVPVAVLPGRDLFNPLSPTRIARRTPARRPRLCLRSPPEGPATQPGGLLRPDRDHRPARRRTSQEEEQHGDQED